MMKKILIIVLICSTGITFCATQKPASQKARPAKVRMVTLTDRELEMINRAHELAVQKGKKSPVVAKYAQRIAKGQITMTKEERDELMHQVMFQLAREAKMNRNR